VIAKLIVLNKRQQVSICSDTFITLQLVHYLDIELTAVQ